MANPSNQGIINENTTSGVISSKIDPKTPPEIDRNINKKEVDYILYCTQSPEYFLPTTACILQDKIELEKNIGAFDFNLGCSGYTYGLSFAKALIESGQAKKVLLVTAETYSKLIHEKDRTNRSIFGDAATATIISESTENNIHDFLFGTDGKGYDKLIVKNGASRTYCCRLKLLTTCAAPTASIIYI